MLNQSKQAKFFRLAIYSFTAACLLSLLWSYVRLSNAGLGCPDWPGCYGKLFAPITAQDLDTLRSYTPRIVLEEEKVLRETVQRYVSGVLGLLIIRLAMLGWQLKKRYRRQQWLIPLSVFVLVFTQVAIGVLTVRLQYKPLVVMFQLVAGMSIIGLLWWVILREERFWLPVVNAPPRLLARLRLRALFALVLVILQILLGGWVSANYAALACPDLPTCQGRWWPEMDMSNGFALWRDIGLDYSGSLLDLPAATGIHMAHRLAGLGVFLYVGWLALHTIRVGFKDKLWGYGVALLFAVLLETALGLTSVLARLPLPLAVGHYAGAIVLLVSAITYYHVVRPPKR